MSRCQRRPQIDYETPSCGYAFLTIRDRLEARNTGGAESLSYLRDKTVMPHP